MTNTKHSELVAKIKIYKDLLKETQTELNNASLKLLTQEKEIEQLQWEISKLRIAANLDANKIKL